MRYPLGKGKHLEDFFIVPVDKLTQWVILDPMPSNNVRQ